ncbi:hypothetical protein [Aquimarina brevivitae]|uniref:Lipoprotein n=1 Tax=Aquimarina brevivitae TaxID=323412 RepID=A0A4Q7PEW1_9FLAO|nr:hypothetical protein [Aquimarina brevivitae]RZS98976.1 hypothetical protein EV197_0178 [Aquimarina brevivitae]
MMKKYVFILAAGIALASCSSKKQATASTFDPNNNPYYVKKGKSKEVTDPIIKQRIVAIIEEQLNISTSSIAISPITLTSNGYQWKFMNVKNGKSFVGSTDVKFESVTIEKINRNKDTQVTDF